MRKIAACVVFVLLAVALPRPAAAQSPSDGWKVTVYPIFVWVPLGLSIGVTLPPVDGGGGGSETREEIIDGRFDGAFMGGVNVSKGPWRIDTDGLWAAVGGDRIEFPVLTVDSDIFYWHASGGRQIFKDVFVTGGVRRLAVKYDIKLGERNFERKPGIWDPLIGVGWHRIGNKVEYHAAFEGGGFGVGADVDLGGSARIDWKPATHFGLTVGYSFFHFEVEDTLVGKTFTVDQTLHGPIFGIGLYF